MHPLSKDVDLSFLIGQELIQVCVGANELILNFQANARITVLSDFIAGGPDRESQRYSRPSEGAPAVFPLLHQSIIQARATESGGLLLVFVSGAFLEVCETSAEYESFWISHDGRNLIV
jgi:hypothetical protein